MRIGRLDDRDRILIFTHPGVYITAVARVGKGLQRASPQRGHSKRRSVFAWSPSGSSWWRCTCRSLAGSEKAGAPLCNPVWGIFSKSDARGTGGT